MFSLLDILKDVNFQGFFFIILGAVIKSLFRLVSLVSWSLNTDLRMGIILNEFNTSNKRESSQNTIEILRLNSQDVSLSIYSQADRRHANSPSIVAHCTS